MSFCCPKDMFYPKCPDCEPYNSDVCPIAHAGPFLRRKSARRIPHGYYDSIPTYIGAFASDIEAEPRELPSKVLDSQSIGTEPLTVRRFIVPIDGKRLKGSNY